MKEAVKELWRLCFNDSEEFVDMYFRLRYDDDINVTIQDKEKVVAALQMLPYPMTFCGHTVQTSYISGACTHPGYRGNGMMRQLLGESFKRMFNAGIHFSTLIPAEPWLFDYYANAGYAPVFHYSKELLPQCRTSVLTGLTIESTNEFEEAVYEYVNRQMEKRPCCIQHTVADFKVILADLHTTHDALFVVRKGEKIVGTAITYSKGDSLLISELFADNEEIKQHLLCRIQQAGRCTAITLITPPADNAGTYPIGMARIIDAKGVLQLYAATYPEHEMSIELTDEQLSANNGYYYLYKGKCMYDSQRLPGVHLQLTIGELTEMIFAPLHPYMSLMLN